MALTSTYSPAQLLGILAAFLFAIVHHAVRAYTKSIYAYSSSSSSSSSSTTNILLLRSPNRLTGVHLVYLFAKVIAKYIPGTRGNRAKLRPDPNDKQRFALDRIRVEGPLTFDKHDRLRFARALLRRDDDDKTNEMLLVALTAPLSVFVLSLHECPIKPLGAVNTRNVFHFLDRQACRSSVVVEGGGGGSHWTFVATFGGQGLEGVRRKRGMEFSMTIDVRTQDGTLILQQELFFLQFLAKSVEPRFDPSASIHKDAPAAALNAPVKRRALPELSIASPRLWAATCGDYNPIHIAPFAAKMFGFASTIAHGNHVVALAIDAGLMEQHGQEGTSSVSPPPPLPPCTLDVSFLKPMLLPRRLEAQWQQEQQQQQQQRDMHSVRLSVVQQGEAVQEKQDVFVTGTCQFHVQVY